MSRVAVPGLLLAASVAALLAFGLERASLAAAFLITAGMGTAWAGGSRAERGSSPPAADREAPPAAHAAPHPEPPPALPAPRPRTPRCRRPLAGETLGAASYAASMSDDQIFLRAAADGDVETLRHMLERGQPVDTRAVWGDSALRIAVQAARREAVELLLAAGADPFAAPPGGGATAFHLLAARGERLDLLRRHGVDERRDQPDLFGRTPLLEAARCGRLEAARTLLETGADARARDVYGQGALHHAVCGALDGRMAERRALIELLAASGARPEAPDAHGDTPLSIAAGIGCLELLRAIDAQTDREAVA